MSSLPDYRPCVVIPVYRHARFLTLLLDRIARLNLPCVLVNDGGDAEESAILRQLATRPEVFLQEQFPNQGKGAAMFAGFRYAGLQGFSHAVQIDADGQHKVEDIPRLLAASRATPGALITGTPQYDQSVPKHRLYARHITHFWVWVETLSFTIRDSMCGFRVYPLADTLAVVEHIRNGRRMDFDTEIMVRLYWRGVPVISIPTPVTYPEDGISNFRPLHDNLLISWMHTRLVCGMLLRLPVLLARKFAGKRKPGVSKPS
jgi:glycosyltransferase involved in cell wall biosynthesis